MSEFYFCEVGELEVPFVFCFLGKIVEGFLLVVEGGVFVVEATS
ncbi:hypothetical protein ACQCU1_09170 [Sutcliffiella horikoshii]|nr:hypothetical protein [Sutcliffiella horikoshii]